MAGGVKFSQELLDQCAAAVREKVGNHLGFVLMIQAHPEDGGKMMMFTNMGRSHAMNLIAAGADALLGLEDDPREGIDKPR